MKCNFNIFKQILTLTNSCCFVLFHFFNSKELRSLRVVRVELDNGRRLVGLRYPEPLITEVSQLIKQQKLNAAAVWFKISFSVIHIFKMRQGTKLRPIFSINR